MVGTNNSNGVSYLEQLLPFEQFTNSFCLHSFFYCLVHFGKEKKRYLKFFNIILLGLLSKVQGLTLRYGGIAAARIIPKSGELIPSWNGDGVFTMCESQKIRESNETLQSNYFWYFWRPNRWTDGCNSVSSIQYCSARNDTISD